MRMTRARTMLAGVGAAILMLAGVGSSVQAQATVEVRIEGIVFQPAAITVPAGTTVVWVNYDPVIHGVTANDGSFASELFGQGESFMATFAAPGVYEYFCPPHPGMVGTIEVTG